MIFSENRYPLFGIMLSRNSNRRRERPQIRGGSRNPERRAEGVLPRPGHDQRAGRGAGLVFCQRIELIVGRLDDEERVRPVRQDQYRAGQPTPILRLPRRNQAENSRQQGEARLHLEATRVAELPFRQQARIVERQPRRLLGLIDVKRRARKSGGEGERGWTSYHRSSPRFTPAPDAPSSRRLRPRQKGR